MDTWVIVSWVGVALMTAANVFVFLKLKKASEQMLKTAFPGAKDMNDALAQMQRMMAAARKAQGRGGFPGGFRGPGMPKVNDAQLKSAMEMLQNMQKKK